MKYIMIKFCAVIALVFVFSIQGFSQNENQTQNFPEVTLKRTEIRSLHSNIVGEDYELMISLPRSYKNIDKNYPVIYLLDPFRTFLISKGYTDALTTPMPIIPEVIIVGIGYGGNGDEELLRFVLGRTRDLSPAEDTLAEDWLKSQMASTTGIDVEFHTGGAEQFLEFIEDELFPFIESKYRVDKDNYSLCGYSFGGLFALYTLFHKPWLFKNYISGSPGIQYKNEITFKYESDYSKNHSDLNANVFISAGELEELTSVNIKKIEELLRSRNYENLKLKTVVFEDENHITCPPAAISRGIYELLGKDDNL